MQIPPNQTIATDAGAAASPPSVKGDANAAADGALLFENLVKAPPTDIVAPEDPDLTADGTEEKQPPAAENTAEAGTAAASGVGREERGVATDTDFRPDAVPAPVASDPHVNGDRQKPAAQTDQAALPLLHPDGTRPHPADRPSSSVSQPVLPSPGAPIALPGVPARLEPAGGPRRLTHADQSPGTPQAVTQNTAKGQPIAADARNRVDDATAAGPVIKVAESALAGRYNATGMQEIELARTSEPSTTAMTSAAGSANAAVAGQPTMETPLFPGARRPRADAGAQADQPRARAPRDAAQAIMRQDPVLTETIVSPAMRASELAGPDAGQTRAAPATAWRVDTPPGAGPAKTSQPIAAYETAMIPGHGKTPAVEITHARKQQPPAVPGAEQTRLDPVPGDRRAPAGQARTAHADVLPATPGNSPGQSGAVTATIGLSIAARTSTAEGRTVEWVSEAVYAADTRAATAEPGARQGLMADLVQRPGLAQQVAQQLADTVRLSGSARQVELQLNPAELGRVTLSLNSSDGQVTVQVVAERPETLDLIRRHAGILAREFAGLGYQSSEFSFGHQGGGHKMNDHERGQTDTATGVGSDLTGVQKTSGQDSAPAVLKLGSDRIDIRL